MVKALVLYMSDLGVAVDVSSDSAFPDPTDPHTQMACEMLGAAGLGMPRCATCGMPRALQAEG